jgi:hypothetical protein
MQPRAFRKGPTASRSRAFAALMTVAVVAALVPLTAFGARPAVAVPPDEIGDAVAGPDAVPNAPAFGEIEARPYSVIAHWTPPAAGSFTAIRVVAHLVGQDPDVVAPQAEGWVPADTVDFRVLIGLSPGTTYRFRVRAVNGTAQSAWVSKDATTTADPGNLPGPPTGVTATAANGAANLNWVAPAQDGGTSIYSYTAASSSGRWCFNTGELSCQVGDLRNGVPVTFRVAATNGWGVGPASEWSAAVTPFSVPVNPPTITQAAPSFDSTSVTWTAPASGPFTGFRIRAHLGGHDPSETPVATKDVGSFERSVTLVGLAPNTAYQVRVTTLNGEVTSVPSNAVTITTAATPTAPTAPRSPTAQAKRESAVVSWTASASTGGSPITGYTVTSLPGGKTCSTPSTTCTVTGLTGGQYYTFTVKATNAVGASPASEATSYITPWSGSGYHAQAPQRVLDSRTANGGWASTKLTAGAPRTVKMTGGDVPATATAVVVNVTVTNGTAGSFLTVYPNGATVPKVSNLNFAAGETIPNLVTVKLGPGGLVAFANAVGAVDVIADLVGWYDDGTGVEDGYDPAAPQLYEPMQPQRILDSRTATGGWGSTPLGTATRELAVPEYGLPGLGATSVVVNITATESTGGSFLTAWPAGSPKPVASNVNFAAGQTIPNLAIVKLGANGAINLANNNGTVHVIVDVVGFFNPAYGDRFHPIDPVRMLDDRTGVGGIIFGPWGPGQTRHVAIGGGPVPGVSPDASAYVLNTTVTNGTAGSFLTVFAGGTPPQASNLNFGPGQTIANLVYVKASPGFVDIYNKAGSVDVIADAVGWFAPY